MKTYSTFTVKGSSCSASFMYEGYNSAGDVEAGGDDTERREVLEKRLAHVRNQMPEEQKPK
jgi:hypothetical protein